MRMTRVLVLACALACAGWPAEAQTPLTKWTGVEGTVTISFPAGWRRLDEMMRKRFPGSVQPDVEIEMDKGDAIMGEPGVSCRLRVKRMTLPPDQTADVANKKIRENPALKQATPQEPGMDRRVRFMGDAVAVESSKIAGNREDFMTWTSIYARGENLLTPNIICMPNVPRTGITAKDAADVRAMFDAISVSLK